MMKPIVFSTIIALVLVCLNCQSKQADETQSQQTEEVKAPQEEAAKTKELTSKKTEAINTPKTEEGKIATKAIAPPPSPIFQAFECNGNEPFWNIKVEVDKITYRQLGETPVVYPYHSPSKSDQITTFETAAEVAGKKSMLKFTLEEKTCTDNMSGKKSPYSVRVEKDGAEYTGCGDKK